MSLQEEYTVIEFLKCMLKADETFCKNNGTDTFQRACQRKTIEMIADARKSEIEQIYHNLLMKNKDNKKSEENINERN